MRENNRNGSIFSGSSVYGRGNYHDERLLGSSFDNSLLYEYIVVGIFHR